MERLPVRYQKPVAIAIFVGSLLLSFGILLIPINPQEMAVFGYGGIFIITLLGAMTLFVPAPTMVAAFVIGSVLNPFFVSLVAGFGSALGETTGYLAGYGSRALVAEPEQRNRWYLRIYGWMEDHTFLTLFLFSAIPNFITDVSGLIAGRISYPYYKFLLATFLGKTVRFGLVAFLGAAFGIYLFKH